MKKILLAMLIMAPMSIMAQTKFAHFDMNQIVPNMKEYTTAQSEIQSMQKQYEDDLKLMQDELQKKSADYQKEQANLLDNVKARREEELNNLYQRIQQTYQDNQTALQKATQEKMGAISDKVMAAVKKLGEAGGYIYVVDSSSGSIAFVNPAVSIDITNQLKKELGVSDTPATAAAPAKK